MKVFLGDGLTCCVLVISNYRLTLGHVRSRQNQFRNILKIHKSIDSKYLDRFDRRNLDKSEESTFSKTDSLRFAGFMATTTHSVPVGRIAAEIGKIRQPDRNHIFCLVGCDDN